MRSQDEEGNHGKIVAIDIETGAFEVADNWVKASKQLTARVPDAQTWFIPHIPLFGEECGIKNP